jgi:hypothetical protein
VRLESEETRGGWFDRNQSVAKDQAVENKLDSRVIHEANSTKTSLIIDPEYRSLICSLKEMNGHSKKWILVSDLVSTASRQRVISASAGAHTWKAVLRRPRLLR